MGAPLGYSNETKTKQDLPKPSQADLEKLKVKKAWEFAISPAKNIPMNLIMSYMTGNSLQLIPIMMTLMLLWTPLAAIFTQTGAGFRPYTTEKNKAEVILPKVTYVFCNLVIILIGLWKLDRMGIIPYHEADWLDWKFPAMKTETLAVLF